MVLVNNSECCGINVGCQFPLTVDIRAMVVVFVDVCSRVSTWVKGGGRKKANFYSIAELKAHRTTIVVTL
jgi:hypothetical protein